VACLASSLIALRRFRNLEWKYVKYMAVVGMVGSGIPAFLFATAQTRISSYLAGMLNALTPVFTILIGSFIFRSRFNNRQLWGVLIGFIGACGLVFIRSKGSIQSDLFFTLLIVLATACYGLSVNTVKHRLSGQDTLLISAVGLIIVGLPYGIYLFQTDFVDVLYNHPQASKAFASLVTLSVFGTALSNLLFFRLVKEVLPTYKFEYFVDYIEGNLKNEDFLHELKEVLKVWTENEIIKSTQVEDTAKKKTSRGRK